MHATLITVSAQSWKLLVIIHNLKGYDGHLIAISLKNEFGKVRVIPQNMEKILVYICGETQRSVENIRG